MTPMPRKRDVLRQRFGSLVVVEECGRSPSGKIIYRCKCDCGGETKAIAGNLFSGNRKTCGCSHYRHGKLATDGQKGAYSSWKAMRFRCSSRHRKHHRYVRLGYCSRWESFEAFYSDMGDRPPSMTLDRIDNDKGYFPGNCRWATRVEQARNTSHTKPMSFVIQSIDLWQSCQGITQKQFCKNIGVSPTTLRRWIKEFAANDRESGDQPLTPPHRHHDRIRAVRGLWRWMATIPLG
jgi:hypothetical protein